MGFACSLTALTMLLPGPLSAPWAGSMPGHYRGALTRPRGVHASSLLSRRPDFSGRLQSMQPASDHRPGGLVNWPV